MIEIFTKTVIKQLKTLSRVRGWDRIKVRVSPNSNINPNCKELII